MKKVIVGMSGGVDSSVCALLLKRQGYEVVGATMLLRPEDDRFAEFEGGCCGLSAVEDARRVAECLDIPYYVMNFTDEFRRDVVDSFKDVYLRGATPNPCINCNRHLKWGAFLDRAKDAGADFIATGHYARVIRLENGRYTVRNSVTAGKDQTYVLYSLTQEQLSRTLMPVGEYAKDEVRRIAAEAGLPVAAKKDSQDICFIPDGDYAGFIQRETGSLGTEGFFRDADGKALGRHRGTAAYTVGQRRGLGLALGYPAYVKSIDAVSGDVVVGRDAELYTDTVAADDICYMGEERFSGDRLYTAKIRYSQRAVPCRVEYDGDGITARFTEAVRAPAPGQALVLYSGDWVAGGGTIRPRGI